MLISPWIIGFLLFKLMPILASLILSFTDFNMLRPAETRFSGLANYLYILRDQDAGFAFLSTVGLAVMSVPLQLVVAPGLGCAAGNPRDVDAGRGRGVGDPIDHSVAPGW
jgi:multiple sugar transport system permease protein